MGGVQEGKDSSVSRAGKALTRVGHTCRPWAGPPPADGGEAPEAYAGKFASRVTPTDFPLAGPPARWGTEAQHRTVNSQAAGLLLQ